MSNEIIRRRALSSSGTAIDWESIARGMLDGVTQFEIPAEAGLRPAIYRVYGRTNLSHASIPSGVSVVDSYSFQECTNLLSVDIPEGVTRIGNNAFARCTKLTSIELPSTLTQINSYAFQNSMLTSITIPSSVTTLQAAALSVGNSLIEVVVEATTPPSAGNALLQGNNNLASIYVPDASVEAYKAATNWSTYASKIKGISERPVGGVILNQFNGWLAAAERVAA